MIETATNAARPRRRLQFSLRVLLASLTAAAALFAALALYAQRPSFRVIGALPRGDRAAICRLVETSPQVTDKLIFEMKVISPAQVLVVTGDGQNGLEVLVAKENGSWAIANVSFYYCYRRLARLAIMGVS